MKTEPMTIAHAIDLFDSLEPAKTSQMEGRWTGQDIPTGHPMDGMLASSYWHGKRFEGEDEVYPLVHRFPFWGERSINPALLPLRFLTALPMRDTVLRIAAPLLVPFVSTRKPKARLRTIFFRGRLHAAMCYDARPINDIFSMIDEDTMMGWMDFKGMEQPYFFELSREI